jgi:hypothetical protein
MCGKFLPRLPDAPGSPAGAAVPPRLRQVPFAADCLPVSGWLVLYRRLRRLAGPRMPGLTAGGRAPRVRPPLPAPSKKASSPAPAAAGSACSPTSTLPEKSSGTGCPSPSPAPLKRMHIIKLVAPFPSPTYLLVSKFFSPKNIYPSPGWRGRSTCAASSFRVCQTPRVRPPERQSFRVCGKFLRVCGKFLLQLIAFLSPSGWSSTAAFGGWRGQGCPA